MQRFLFFTVALIVILLSVLAVFMSTSLHSGDQDPAEFMILPSIGDSAAKNVTPKATVGYAMSLIKCGDFQTSAAGLVDSALIMRHSIHLTSIRNPGSGSQYDYKMYAIVHRQAVECSSILKDVGFELVIVDPPLVPDDINGTFLREHIHKEWCCGSDEFVKLYAYSKINHPIVVHVDSDFFFLQHMGELFDAMLYDKDSSQGKAARKAIPMEFPNEHVMPDKIQAFYTRDWPQVIPGMTRAGFQAGFMVVRPNQTVFDELIGIIRKGHFVQGRGWGSLGYRGFVGAMAMQGLLAYYYEAVRPDVGVEVNQCRYNWMGMDIKYRAHPNYRKEFNLTGKCRSNREYCEDCMNTDISLIKNVHLTQCRKPWNCVGEGCPGGRMGPTKGYIDTNAGSLSKCLEIVHMWHQVRTDFEDKLYQITKDENILQGRNGTYMPDVFMGHCNEIFQSGYNRINASPESFRQVPKMYS